LTKCLLGGSKQSFASFGTDGRYGPQVDVIQFEFEPDRRAIEYDVSHFAPVTGITVDFEPVESGNTTGQFQLRINPKRRNAACCHELSLRGIRDGGSAEDEMVKHIVLRGD